MYVVLPNANGHAWGSARCVTSTQTAFEDQEWRRDCASDGSDERLPPAQSWNGLRSHSFAAQVPRQAAQSAPKGPFSPWKTHGWQLKRRPPLAVDSIRSTEVEALCGLCTHKDRHFARAAT